MLGQAGWPQKSSSGSCSAVVWPGGGQLQMRTPNYDFWQPCLIHSDWALGTKPCYSLLNRHYSLIELIFSVSCHRVICRGGWGTERAFLQGVSLVVVGVLPFQAPQWSSVSFPEVLLKHIWLAGCPTFYMKLLFLWKLIVCSFLHILCKSGNLL